MEHTGDFITALIVRLGMHGMEFLKGSVCFLKLKVEINFNGTWKSILEDLNYQIIPIQINEGGHRLLLKQERVYKAKTVSLLCMFLLLLLSFNLLTPDTSIFIPSLRKTKNKTIISEGNQWALVIFSAASAF